AVTGDRLRGGVAEVGLREISAIHVVQPELVEILAVAGQYHHARSGRHRCRAACQQRDGCNGRQRQEGNHSFLRAHHVSAQEWAAPTANRQDILSHTGNKTLRLRSNTSSRSDWCW